MTQTIKTDDASGRGMVSGVRVPFPGRQHGYSEEAFRAVQEIMCNADGQTQGQYLKQFESDLSGYLGSKNVFVVDNCTNALALAATLCLLGPSDEVIIPAYTFCATAIPFGRTGARIVWADIDPKTWVVDPADIERKITSMTKVIMVVHLLGMPADMPRIMEIAKKYNLRVVEDCAQALGASIDGEKVGTFGDFGCFSFHGAKTITTLGEGGALAVRCDDDARLVAGIRHNGVRGFEGERDRYWVPAMSNVDIDIEGVWPNNFCLGEAQCAVGSAELKKVDEYNDTIIAQHRKIAARLVDTPEIEFAMVPAGYRHIYHQYVMLFNNKGIGASRNDLMDILVNDYRIRSVVQYYPLFRYPLFQKMGFGSHDCPVLDKWWDNSFSFPWWCGMDDETIDYMCDSTRAAIKRLRERK